MFCAKAAPSPLFGTPTLISTQCRHKGNRYILRNRAVGSTNPNSVPTLRQLLTHLKPPKHTLIPVKHKRHRARDRLMGKGNYIDTTRFVDLPEFQRQFLDKQLKTQTFEEKHGIATPQAVVQAQPENPTETETPTEIEKPTPAEAESTPPEESAAPPTPKE